MADQSKRKPVDSPGREVPRPVTKAAKTDGGGKPAGDDVPKVPECNRDVIDDAGDKDPRSIALRKLAATGVHFPGSKKLRAISYDSDEEVDLKWLFGYKWAEEPTSLKELENTVLESDSPVWLPKPWNHHSGSDDST